MHQNYWRTIAQFYNLLGHKNNLAKGYESRARTYALEQLGVTEGQRLLEVGLGNGISQGRLLEACGASGLSAGVDLAGRMIKLAYSAHPQMLPAQATALALPFAPNSFDRLYATYLLDIIPETNLLTVFAEFNRVLKLDGRLVVASLTEGIDPLSRTMISIWKRLYRINPILCGVCRPLELTFYLEQVGFTLTDRQVIVQLGIPSEVITAAPTTI